MKPLRLPWLLAAYDKFEQNLTNLFNVIHSIADIDECSDISSCINAVSCTNQDGGYMCGPCISGFFRTDEDNDKEICSKYLLTCMASYAL